MKRPAEQTGQRASRGKIIYGSLTVLKVSLRFCFLLGDVKPDWPARPEPPLAGPGAPDRS
jgi:hypothetical protein